MLLDAAPFVFDAGADPLNATLMLADVNGVATVQVADTASDSILASRPLSETSAIVVEGSGSDDVLTVDLTDNNALTGIPITFQGGAGDDSMLLAGGSFDQVKYSLLGPDSGQVLLDGNASAISFSSLENIVDISDASDRQFVNETGTSQQIQLADDGEFNGIELIDSEDPVGFTPIWFAEPSHGFSIHTGDVGDHVLVGDLEEGFAAAIDIEGGAGADTLESNAADAAWSITGNGSGVLNDSVSFSAMENLTGGPDTNDTFVFEDGGSIEGVIDGGAGGVDNIVIHSATQTAIVVPDESGSVTFEGRTIHYSNIEPFVDATDPSTTWINGTSFNDDVSLDVSSSDPSSLEIRIHSANFISNGALTDTWTFSAPTDALYLDLRDGDDALGWSLTGSTIPTLLAAGSAGMDRLTGPNATNTWLVTAADGGTLNDTINFSGFENISGGTSADTFTIAAAGSVTGPLDGGAGSDELRREEVSSLWTITGDGSGNITNPLTAEAVAAFEGMESLSGSADGSDTFFIAPGGSIAGTVDGGSGGVDQLLLASTTESVLVVPDVSGIAAFDGRSIQYTGLEPVIDVADPSNVVIEATVFNDDLTLQGNPDQSGDPQSVLLQSASYGFLSGGAVADSIAFSAANAVSIYLREGDDRLDIGKFNPGFNATAATDGGDGNDELDSSESFNSWTVDDLNGGLLNSRFQFASFENLRGGSDRDFYFISENGSLDGTLYGDDGSNVLTGPSLSVTWNVTGANSGELINQETGGSILKFVDIQILVGADDNVDSFIISTGGSLSGNIEGGDGGFDSLAILGPPDVVVVPGLLFGSQFFDTITRNGVSITYKGLEPFVDATNPADVSINGTGVNDDLTLAPDPTDNSRMRVSGSSSLLFYTNGTFSDGISFDTPSIGLSVDLRFGDDTLTIAGLTSNFDVPISINGGFGFDTVVVSGDLFLPGKDLTITAESITVNDGVTISTRQVGGSQDPQEHRNGTSTGNSGNITFVAESNGLLFRALATALIPSLSDPTGITIGTGAALVSQVDEANAGNFTPGSITLTARDENGLGLPGFLLSGLLSGLYKNDAEVSVKDGAVLRGGNISLLAAAKFSPQPDFLDQKIFDSEPYSLQETEIGKLLGKIPVTVGKIASLGSKKLTGFLVKKVTGQDSLPLQLLGKISEATINIHQNAEITASANVILESRAIADATTKVDNPLFSVSLSVGHATAETLIGTGVQITAGGSVSAVANAAATAKSESETNKNAKSNPKVAKDLSAKTFSLAVSESQTTAHTTLAEGAEIHAGGSVQVTANGASENEAGAKVAIFFDGSFGVSVAVGIDISDIHATVNGTITSAATAAPAFAFSNIDKDKDTIDIQSPYSLVTGQAVVYHADPSVAIDKLTDGKTYFAIVEPGSGKIKLAAELGDALRGKAIDLKAPSGTLTASALEAAPGGVSISANLDSSDKATSETGIGDTDSTGGKIKGAVAGFSVVKKIIGKLPFGKLEEKRKELEGGGLAASGSSSKPSDYSIVGVLSFFLTDQHVIAEVTGTGTVQSRGDIEVRSSLTDKVQSSAEATIDAEKSANAKKKKSGSVALSAGIYGTTVHALIGDGASLDASGALTVDSSVLYPFLTEPSELFTKKDFTTLEGVKKLADGKLGLQDKLLNSWSVSAANADELSISGSLSWISFDNESTAEIGSNANINQNIAFLSDAQAVSVKASVETQMVNMTGVFDFEIDLTKLLDLYKSGDKLAKKLADLNPLGPGFESDGKGFGGALFILLVDNHTTARIGSGAQIHTGTGSGLTVSAESKMFDIAMVQSGGKGGDFGAAGSFSIILDSGQTWAHIESGAVIDGGFVTLEAEDDTNHWNAVGGFMKGDAHGVGASVSINIVNRDTEAFIGTESGKDPGIDTDIHVGGDLTITASGTGNIHTFSLAADVESNEAMKGDATDPLDGVSLPILFGDAKPEKEPSKTGLGIAANVAWNTVNDTTRAFINDSSTFKADDISLEADNDRGIVSAAGAAAIAKTKASETSTALAGAFSLNQLKIETQAFVTGATLETTLVTEDDAEEISLTAKRNGLLFAFSGGGAGAATKNGSGGMGSVSINRVLDSTSATLDGVTVHTAGDITLSSNEASSIISIAGGGAYGDNKGVGGAIALNQIAGQTKSAILGDAARSAIGTADVPAGNIDLTASNDNSIQSVALSVGASKGGGLAVTLAINLIANDPVSGSENKVESTINNADVHSNGDLTLHASDDSTLQAIGGAVGIGKDKFGFGAALGWNQVNGDVTASIEDAGITSGAVHLTAEITDAGPLLDGKIVAAAVGAAGSKQTAIGGALSINVIRDNVDAHISASTTLTSTNEVTLTAQDTSSIKALTGGVAISTGSTAVGAAIGVNDIHNNISATIDGASVTSTSSNVELDSHSNATIDSITVGGSGAGSFAVGGSVAVNLVRNTIDAHVANILDPTPDDADVLGVHAAGEISIKATDDSTINGITGGIAGSKQNAIGAALTTSDIADHTTAYIAASTAAANSLELEAQSNATVRSLAVGGSGAGDFALGGSLAVNIVANTLDAHVSGGSQIGASGDIAISAIDNTSILAGAGGFAGAGSTAIGAALASNDTANTTTSYIDGSTVHSAAGSIGVSSDSTVDIQSATVSGGGAGSTNVNGSIAVHVTHNKTSAYVGAQSHVTADGNLVVSAADDLSMLAGAGNLGGAGSTAVGVSSSTVITNNTTEAYVADGAVLSALGNRGASAVFTGEKGAAASAIGGLHDGMTYYAIVDGNDPSRIRLAKSADKAAAGIAIDLDPSQATGNAHELRVPAASGDSSIVFDPASAIANDNSIDLGSDHELETGDALVYRVPKGDRITENIRGVAVTAVSFEQVIDIAVGGQGAGSIGGAGSVTVNTLNETTHSYIGGSASINAKDNDGANAEQSVVIRASDKTTLFSLSGAVSGGGSAGIGAGIDVGVITKRTEVYVDDGAEVHSRNDVALHAQSSEDIRSLTAALTGGGSAGIAGAAGVYVLNLTTLARIGSEDGTGATVSAGDSVLVSAADNSELDLIGGSITGGGAGSVGASAAVPVIDKTTTAFIGAHSTVSGNGNGDGAVANTGLFDVAFAPDKFELGEVPSPLFFAKNGITVDVTGDGVPDLNDPQLTQNRVATPQTATVRGVAVTAVNQDNIEAIGASGGGSGSLSIAVGGSVNVINTHTRAFIADSAKVNTDQSEAAAGQSVLVAAGNDFAHVGMALVPAGSGAVAVTPGADVTVVNNNTEAFIADGADVHAAGNIAVSSNASEDILSLTAGVAVSGVVSVGGAVSVVVINNETHAHIGDHASETQPAASVIAGGSILVSAQDSTDIDLIAGSLGIGISGGGAGASVGVSVIHKDTQAFIGDGAVVDARGNGIALTGLYDGGIDANGFSTGGDIHGLAVQAASFENLVSVAAAAAGGFYAGIAGGVSSALIDSSTEAFIGAGALVNQDSTDSADLQDVNVTAINGAKALGVTGGLGIGIAGIGGAVDIGIIRNDTSAYIGTDASVRATHNVSLNALSLKDVHTLAVAAGGGIVGAVGSVSVWTIGSKLDSSYTTDDDSHDALSTNSGTYSSVTGFVDAMAGGKIAGNGFASILKGHNNPTFDPATAVDSEADTIDLGTNHGLHQGDAVVYRNNGGSNIGGLEDGERYFVILDADNPNLIRLAATQHDALSGTAIDLDGTVSTGTAHRLEPHTGSVTNNAGETISDSAPANEISSAAGSTDSINGVAATVRTGATIVAGGDIGVRAEELLTYNGQTGSVAAGVGGIGGSVTIANIESHADARIDSNATVTEGGIGRTITVSAILNENISGSAFAGQAGLIAAGAQVVVLNDNSTEAATIADGVVIENAGLVSVIADATRTVSASATGGGIGAVALGAAVSIVNVHGGTDARVEDATIGRDTENPSNTIPTVGALVVEADAVVTAEAHTAAVEAGLGGGAADASVAAVTVDPGVHAVIGDDADILVSGDVAVNSRMEGDATSEAQGVAVGPTIGALGASVAMASLLPEISADIGEGASVIAGNDVTLRSASNYDRQGGRLKKGARATATSGSGGLAIGGSGAFATVDNSPKVETSVGNGSTVTAGHDVLMAAAANNTIPLQTVANPLHPSQQIEIGGAQASGTGFGAVGVGVSVSKATIGGSVKNHIDFAAVTAGNDLTLVTESVADVNAKAWAVSGGISGGTGNKTTVEISTAIDTFAGAGSVIHAGGDIRLASNFEGNIEAEARGLSVAGVSIGVSLVDAAMHPDISSYIGPAAEVTAGGSVSLVSLANESATGPLDKGVHATGNSSGGGALSGNGADIRATNGQQVEASIGSGDIISAGEDVTAVARSHNEASASGVGNSVGVIGIGAIVVHAEANGAASAAIGSEASITAVRDVILSAAVLAEGTATAQASGGGLASGNGADASVIVSPTVTATAGTQSSVASGRDVQFAAQAETHSTATATGTTVGGIAVGASIADAETHPTVTAAAGDTSSIQAGHSITISATYNIADDGSGINTVRATATGSSGSLLAGILAGADATTIADVHASANLGKGARLDITGNSDDSFIAIASRAYNSVDVTATGNSSGLFTGNTGASGTHAKAVVTTIANTIVGDNASIGGNPALQGHLRDVSISSAATSVVNGSATGASGKDIAGSLSDLFSGQISVPSILSGGGTVIEVDIENAANTTIGALAVILAAGQVSITADGTIEVHAGASMTSGGVVHADAAVLADVFVDLDSNVTVGDATRVEGDVVLLGTHSQLDGDATSTANANVSLGVADAAATSRMNAGSTSDPSQAVVSLGSNTRITGRSSLSFEAVNDQADGNLVSKATAKSFGAALTGDAIAEANGTLQIRSTVSSGAGSALSSGNLSVNADSTVGIDRLADSDAASFVTQFVKEARTVVRKITKWLPWPLNKIVETITETIFVLVPKVVAVGGESAKSTGSGVQSKDTINLNGDIYSVGNQDALLIVHKDPNNPNGIVVDPSSNMAVELVDVDGDGISDISVGNVISDSSSNINITTPKGDIIGDAKVHINKVIGSVHVVNETDKNLVLHRLDMVSTNDDNGDLNFQSDNGNEYEVESGTSSSSSLNIENQGSGNIIFEEAFSNVTATLDVHNQGGSILAGNSDVYLETGDAGHLALTADHGSIGSAALPIAVQLVRGKLLPNGDTSTLPAEAAIQAHGNVYLEVTGINNTFKEFDANAFVDGIVLDVRSVAGDIHITANTGQLIEKVIENTTDENGDPVTRETQSTRTASAVYELKNVVADSGGVYADVSGDADAGVIDAPIGTVSIHATGSILHADNVFAGTPAGPNAGGQNVLLKSGASIGTPAAALKTHAGKLEAEAPAGIWILNSGALTLGGVTGGPALQSGGPIVVGAMSPVTVTANVTSAADIVLSSGDSPDEGDDLVITNGAIIQSTAGSVTLSAGDNFRLDPGSAVIAAGALRIIVDAGDADPGVGGAMIIGGALTGHPITLGGSSGNDTIVITHVDVGTPLTIDTGDGNDTILIGTHANATSNSGGTLASILDALTIEGGAGFDRLLIDDSGETANSIGALNDGKLSGLGLVTPIVYRNIDEVVIDLGSGCDRFQVGSGNSAVVLNTHNGDDLVVVGAITTTLVVDLGAGNDRLETSKDATGDITAYGGSGDDHIEGGRGNDILFGGDGNDKLEGRDGNDILIGGEGNDGLNGGAGADVLVGGGGHDRVIGGPGPDILIGGKTLYDGDIAALRAIRSEWARTDIGERERIQHLICGGGLNGSVVLTSATVVDDHVRDMLRGSFCTDWIITFPKPHPFPGQHRHDHHDQKDQHEHRSHHDDRHDSGYCVPTPPPHPMPHPEPVHCDPPSAIKEEPKPKADDKSRNEKTKVELPSVKSQAGKK